MVADTLVAVALVVFSAFSVFATVKLNQWLERDSDE